MWMHQAGPLTSQVLKQVCKPNGDHQNTPKEANLSGRTYARTHKVLEMRLKQLKTVLGTSEVKQKIKRKTHLVHSRLRCSDLLILGAGSVRTVEVLSSPSRNIVFGKVKGRDKPVALRATMAGDDSNGKQSGLDGTTSSGDTDSSGKSPDGCRKSAYVSKLKTAR